MKMILFILCLVLAGCGAKTNEDIAKDLVREKLKATLPDFKNNYEEVTFGTLGTASQPYEETEQYLSNTKMLITLKDSITVLDSVLKENKAAAAADKNKKRLQELKDSVTAKSERNSAVKQSYIPEKLFKITHSYTVKDKLGMDKRTEEEFYFDKDLKKVVKVQKLY